MIDGSAIGRGVKKDDDEAAVEGSRGTGTEF